MTEHVDEITTTRQQRIALVKALIDTLDIDDDVVLSQPDVDNVIYLIYDSEFIGAIDANGEPVQG